MSNIWHDIDPKRIKPEEFIAVIEITKGSKKKYELDKETVVDEVQGREAAIDIIAHCIDNYINCFCK